MIIKRKRLLSCAFGAFAALAAPKARAAFETVRIGGPSSTTLAFLPILAARTFNSFAQQGLDLSWISINGGDPSALAALDSGDIDLAATGSDSVLEAAAKGQPFQIVYSLMSKMCLNMTVSSQFLKRTGASMDMPITARIASLKDTTIGVSAVGGTQDRLVRWLAVKGGLDPKKDIKLVQVGSPAALGAALENGRIDGFVLTAPAGQTAEAEGYGKIFIEPDRDITGISGMPSLVLVARSDAKEATQKKIVKALRAVNAGSRSLLADLDGGTEKLRLEFFPKISSTTLRKSVASLADGIKDDGLLNEQRVALLVKFAEESGKSPPKASQFWTNSYVEAALRSN
jgi:NitT/TauT family transport system substrate-binding protein